MTYQRLESPDSMDSNSMSNSPWQVEIDRASSAEWSQLLNEFDDANFYQTSAYGEVRWGERNLSRLVLKREGEVAAIAQFRIIRPTPLKFGIAYLRWGPLWERRGCSVDPEVPVQMAKAIEDEYLRSRKLCVRILPNAFAGTVRAGIFQNAFGRFAEENQGQGDIYRTFLLDLSPSLDELRKRLDAKWRNKLKQAEKNQLTVISANDSAAFRTFSEIYREMLMRKAFDTTVDVDEFGRMQEILGESQRMQVFICECKGVPVAGLVVSAIGNSAIYLLGATSDAGLDARGAYLLQWTAFHWLKERGVRWYDLGGIDPEANPGVYSFKKGFSGEDICQIAPLIASDSTVSFGMARASLVLKQTLRTSLKPRRASSSDKKAIAAG